VKIQNEKLSRTEELMLEQPELLEGLAWGKPRRGHPEGTVEPHVLEIWDQINPDIHTEAEMQTLRHIALVHDSFKYQVDPGRNRTGENHHGWYARRFAERFIDDISTLEIIQWHDEPFNIHRGWPKPRSQERWQALLERPIDWEMFLEFFIIDGSTGDKITDSIGWFQERLQEAGKIKGGRDNDYLETVDR